MSRSWCDGQIRGEQGWMAAIDQAAMSTASLKLIVYPVAFDDEGPDKLLSVLEDHWIAFSEGPGCNFAVMTPRWRHARLEYV